MKKISALLTVLFLILTLVGCSQPVVFDVSFVVDGEVYATVGTSGEEMVKMPENPTKEGYTFDGWYWDKDVWCEPFTANSLLNAPLSSDMSVYAKWKSNEITYKITFETNGGTAVAEKNVSVIEAAPVTTKDYYTFMGWYSDPSFNESTKITFPFTPENDLTLYAKWAIAITEGLQFALQADTNTYAVTGYTGTDSVIVIPSQNEGLDVTAINDRAFEGNTTITKVAISDSVTSIGSSAFSGCVKLISIAIPDSVTSIGERAFEDCSSLTSVTIPDSVTSIIGWYAFYKCSSLMSVTIGNGVTGIGYSAFSHCSSLMSVTIGNDVTGIGERAFEYCSSLTSVTIPDSVTSIYDYAFYECSSLASVTIGNGVTSIGNSAFSYCSSLTSITIPDSVTRIGSFAFEDCSSLTSVTIPDSVTSIYDHAFYRCSSLTSITIPFVGATKSGTGTSNTHFGYIFGASSCIYNDDYVPSSLKTVIITNGVTSIGEHAFWNCYNLTSITIPDSVTSIGNYAFEYCSSLSSITFNGNGTWYRTTNSNYTGGIIIDVTSPSDNATYFTNPDESYYWYKK